MLRTVTYKNMHALGTSADDNPTIYVNSINDTCQIGVQMKSISIKDYTYLNNDMIIRFKFNANDIQGTSLLNHAYIWNTGKWLNYFYIIAKIRKWQFNKYKYKRLF
jgi:hypothetical protein